VLNFRLKVLNFSGTAATAIVIGNDCVKKCFLVDCEVWISD